MRKDYALLYTDIVDSTAVNSRLGDAAMTTLWDEHDRNSRELLRQWRGREIDRSDGFLVAFEQINDAASFCEAYHRMLGQLPVPLQARAGLHQGALTLRETAAGDQALGARPLELVGIAKAVAARLMALARGGQTLASPQACQALRAHEQERWRCVSHGHWRMKGLDSIVEVFELGPAESAFVPPADSEKSQRVVQMAGAWVGVREVPKRLPAERDSFVGRTAELGTLAAHLSAGARLLTVNGPGGMGKTRLALRYAWAWLGSYPGGVWFCDLASARGLDGLLHAVGQGLDVPLGKDPVGQLGRAIAGRGRCLVILDNFEQLVALARESLGRWLDDALEATFLVTSREVLNLAGESTVALPPLAPDDAMVLFHQRARAAHAAHDARAEPEATRALVELLDGLPLAIELAAPRVRVMPTPQLLARMGDRFRLLAGPGNRPSRQATLHATLAWSWELLSPDERAVLAQLSVFEGGFAWPAVQAVVALPAAADAGDAAPWIIDLLQSLVDKSLVAPQLGARFSLLRSVQEFAAQELAREGSFPAAGPAFAQQAQLSHLRYFAALDEQAVNASKGQELDNLVRACRFARREGMASEAVACLLPAWAALRQLGPMATALALANELRDMPDLTPQQLATVAWVGGHAQHLLGDSELALQTLAEGMAVVDSAPGADSWLAILVARLHSSRGSIHISRRDFAAAEADLRQAQDRLPQCDAATQCTVLNAVGSLAHHQGLHAQARQHYQEALRVAFASNDQRWQSALLGNLAGLLYDEGQLDSARTSYEQSLALAIASGDRRWEGDARCNLGLVHHDQGHHELAAAQLEQSLRIATAIGHARLAHTVLCNLGLVAQARGDMALARQRYQAALQGAQSAGDRHSSQLYQAYLDKLQEGTVNPC